MGAKYGSVSSEITLIDSELNTLANNSISVAGAAVTTAVGCIEANVILTLAAQGNARSANAAISLWLVPESGDVYTDIDESCLGFPDVIFPLDNTANGRSVVVANVQLPNSKFKAVVKNATGQALAASGNSVKIEAYSFDNPS
jgi:hypothetical protein